MIRVHVHEFDLPLRYAFGISRETRTVQKTMIVEVESAGISGYGEAVANHKYYLDSHIDIMRPLVHKSADLLKDTDPAEADPAALHALLAPHFGDNLYALCAVDMALWDLKGKLTGNPTYALWGLNTERIPFTDYTIGIDEIDVMVRKLREYGDWPVFKIKLGTAHDIEIMKALRQETDAVLRVDANCAWTPEETVRNSVELNKLGVEFIEQPLPAEDWDGMKEVFRHSSLPVIADESCIREEDVQRCAGYFHGVNIKVFKCGGLTPARRMALSAREEGLKVMAGCMTESTVGISGIAQLLPLLDYVDMDGPLLLARDLAEGVSIDRGRVSFPDRPGNGVLFTGDRPGG